MHIHLVILKHHPYDHFLYTIIIKWIILDKQICNLLCNIVGTKKIDIHDMLELLKAC